MCPLSRRTPSRLHCHQHPPASIRGRRGWRPRRLSGGGTTKAEGGEGGLRETRTGHRASREHTSSCTASPKSISLRPRGSLASNITFSSLMSRCITPFDEQCWIAEASAVTNGHAAPARKGAELHQRLDALGARRSRARGWLPPRRRVPPSVRRGRGPRTLAQAAAVDKSVEEFAARCHLEEEPSLAGKLFISEEADDVVVASDRPEHADLRIVAGLVFCRVEQHLLCSTVLRRLLATVAVLILAAIHGSEASLGERSHEVHLPAAIGAILRHGCVVRHLKDSRPRREEASTGE